MRDRVRFTILFAALAAGTLALFPAGALAGGFEIQETGKGLGNAYAGAGATADDASTAWWNPAGMTRMRGHAAAASGHLILAPADFRDRGSFRLPAVPFTGGMGETDEPAGVPALFGVYSVNQRLKLGLALNAPFGLSTDWGRTWIGRYHATKSAVTSININPSVAYRLNRWVSVGVGGSAQWAEAELGQAIDFGAAIAMPQTADGHLEVKGDDWSFGFNAGILIEPSARTRIGLTYRSRVEHELEGDADFEVPPPLVPVVTAGGAFVDTAATADIEFPDQIAGHVYHQFNRCWAGVASVTWTGWSTVDRLVINFANPAQAPSTLVLDWEDTFRYAAGVIFTPNDRWTFRLGAAFDDEPFGTETRTPRVPGNDRFWVAGGVGYRLNRCWSVELGYAHLFVDDGDIDLRDPATIPTRGALLGTVESSVDILGLHIGWNQ